MNTGLPADEDSVVERLSDVLGDEAARQDDLAEAERTRVLGDHSQRFGRAVAEPEMHTITYVPAPIDRARDTDGETVSAETRKRAGDDTELDNAGERVAVDTARWNSPQIGSLGTDHNRGCDAAGRI